ncbi:hypothetical protein QFC20_006608 [Naganishia adeliensis]|uniref:Uncharacterized protein n=1 Tax=Naganishia adeliensis TaxID=92952 RepID=A0ACC2VA91_9TREE|nr:hypothetical protein QFC20_006608 [Naganishia adeliensis]
MATEYTGRSTLDSKNLDRGAVQDAGERSERRQKAPTIQIVLRKGPSPPRNHQRQSQPTEVKPTTVKAKVTANISSKTAPAESDELITALSNPLLYQRPALLPALQKIIQSLEVAHSTVEAYASGDYMTEKPLNVALGRVLRAWTEFVSPLNAIHGLKAMNKNDPGVEERAIARQAVGRKLLALAKDKQSCVLAIKKIQRGYEDGSEEAVALGNKQFDTSLVRLIQFATMMATIEYALQIAIERVAVKMIADGQGISRLKERSDC